MIRSSDVGARIDDDVGRRGEVGGRSRHHRPRSIGVDDVDGPVVKAHGTRHEGIREIQRDVHKEKESEAARIHRDHASTDASKLAGGAWPAAVPSDHRDTHPLSKDCRHQDETEHNSADPGV